MYCKYCKSERVVKSGFKATVSKGKRQRYQCAECGRTFYIEKEE